MRSLIVLSCAALMIFSTAVWSAQPAREPGQLGGYVQVVGQAVPNSDGERYSSGIMPRITVANVDDSHARFVNRLWISSMIAAIAGTSLDAGSSWGQREGNGFLASSDGRFGAKGLGIKAAFATAVIVPQICLRKHKELKSAFAVGNFAEAGIFSGVSVHNFRIRSGTGQ